MLILLLLFAPLSANAQRQSEAVRFACSNFPPYNIETGGNRGISVEVISAAMRTAGIPIKFEFFPWNRAFSLVRRGEYDALCGCSYRQEREGIFAFSDTLGNVSQGVFRRPETSNITVRTLADLQKVNVATIRGYALQKELELAKIKTTPVDDEAQLIRMLISEHVNAIYAYRDTILYDLGRMNISTPLDYTEISAQPHYVCFSKINPEFKYLQQKFNRGLRIIKMSGEYERIRSRYISVN
ncbi:MAG: transporter substrate-binding domain-containing protein [Sneathiellales bacterium]|nr:transporter substrate-binding domain-containing protein [Sneathiellales bacterium]